MIQEYDDLINKERQEIIDIVETLIELSQENTLDTTKTLLKLKELITRRIH